MCTDTGGPECQAERLRFDLLAARSQRSRKDRLVVARAERRKGFKENHVSRFFPLGAHFSHTQKMSRGAGNNGGIGTSRRGTVLGVKEAGGRGCRQRSCLQKSQRRSRIGQWRENRDGSRQCGDQCSIV